MMKHTCGICSANVAELRRGRCWTCYTRWVEERPVARGAKCCVCNERRRDFLKSIELHGAWAAMCFSCHGRATRLAPLPDTIAGLREALSRDRRDDDRRFGKRDTRVFQYDRRSDDRRLGRARTIDDVQAIDDEMIVEIDGEAESVGQPGDAEAASCDWSELTRIHEP